VATVGRSHAAVQGSRARDRGASERRTSDLVHEREDVLVECRIAGLAGRTNEQGERKGQPEEG
jgi:hypothetical protein